MATKTITITEDAYKRLARLKSKHESFSDIITRITGRSRILELHGLLSQKASDDLERNIRERRGTHRRNHAARIRRLRGDLA